jgi:hypothetical protein
MVERRIAKMGISENAGMVVRIISAKAPFSATIIEARKESA